MDVGEAAALFYFGTYALSVVLLLIDLVVAVIGLRSPKTLVIIILSIISLILLLPSFLLLRISPSYSSSVVLASAVIASFIILFVTSRNPVSSFLTISALLLLVVRVGLTKGTFFSLIYDRSAIFGKLEFIWQISWFYYSFYLSAGILILLALVYYFRRVYNFHLSGKIIFCITIAIIIFAIIRDQSIYSATIAPSQKVDTTSVEVRKVLFFRNNNLWYTDTSGRSTPVQLSHLVQGSKIKGFAISSDENYIAYNITNSESSELNLFNIGSNQTKKIAEIKGPAELGNSLDFSSDNLLVYSIIPYYPKDSLGNYIQPLPAMTHKIIDLGGNELNSFSNYWSAIWNGPDLVFVDRTGGGNSKVYLSLDAKSTPQKIAELEISRQGLGNNFFMKKPDELIFIKDSGQPGEDYYSLNLKNREVKKVELPEKVNQGTIFSEDMKYYTLVDVFTNTYLIKSTDKSVVIDISNTGYQNKKWFGHYLACETPNGIKAIDLQGDNVQLTDQQGDRLSNN